MTILKYIRNIWNDPYLRILGLLTIIGLFLRTYHLNAFVTFLGDQGRDAIILKRMVTFEHFPAVGAPSSVGQVYLGPFYYYFIAPWLWIFRMNPIGPAVGVAIFSTLSIPAIYFMVRDLFDKRVALLTATCVTFSGTLVQFSRFSWNPNLLPIASFVAIYSFIKAMKTRRWYFFALSGAFFSIAMQMHYVILAVGLPILVLIGHEAWKNQKQIPALVKHILVMTSTFLLLSTPLIIFDARHNFMNVQSFVRLLTHSEASSTGAGIGEIFVTFHALNTYALGYTFISILSLSLLGALLLSACVPKFRKSNYPWMVLFFMFSLIVTSFFTLQKLPHYLGVFYILYYVMLMFVFSDASKKRTSLIWFVVFGFILLQLPMYNFLWGKGSYQINNAQNVAEIIRDNRTSDVYQVTGLPDKYGDSPTRYFLELWGHRALEKDTIEQADELFVICDKPCKPIGDPQWDIAHFAPTEVAGTWTYNDVTIYKLLRKDIHDSK